MSYIPTLYTPRLRLRPFQLADAKRVQELAGDQRIAATTLHVPHPYPDGAAETWINRHQPAAASGKQFNFAITLAGTRTPGFEEHVGDTGHLIGAVSIGSHGDPTNERAEIGYWLGTPYWNKGFTTEAAHAVLDFGFGKRGYRKIIACHMAQNLASGRVMEKLGMKKEATLRQHEQKWGVFVDVVIYGLLADEWSNQRRTRRIPDRVPALQAI
jgi:[ribosomal protein S5]-alanine N-acetyltransferase